MAEAEADGTRSREPWWVLIPAGVVLATFIVLRFWTTSDLWLDEAQTFTIAHLPLTRIPGALREDGSPPLYYFLLHFWMGAFGTSNLAVRSLSGVMGVATLPLSWRMGRALGGRPAAWGALVMVATSPFAVRYSTENRMYMLMILLSLIGFLALRASLARPTAPRLAGVALVSGLLLLTHYWDLYLVAAVAGAVLWRAFRSGPGPTRRASALSLVALVGGFVLFVPWIPSFAYQLGHTGTPWAPRADFTDLGIVLGDFGGLGSRLGDLLGTLYAVLMVLGLFGAASGRWDIHLDLRVRPAARVLGWVALVTLVLAIGASELGNSAYSLRYTAADFVPVVGLVALGVAAIGHPAFRVGAVLGIVVLGVLGSYPNITTNRTQAGEVAATLARQAHAGDVVAYCPDQLGPAVDRLLPAGRYQQVAYPRRGNPDRVDWVDYARVNESSHPLPFARSLVAQAGPGHAVWLVWSPDYATFQGKCNGLLNDLGALRSGRILFYEDPSHFYEHEELAVYPGS